MQSKIKQALRIMLRLVTEMEALNNKITNEPHYTGNCKSKITNEPHYTGNYNNKRTNEPSTGNYNSFIILEAILQRNNSTSFRIDIALSKTHWSKTRKLAGIYEHLAVKKTRFKVCKSIIRFDEKTRRNVQHWKKGRTDTSVILCYCSLKQRADH